MTLPQTFQRTLQAYEVQGGCAWAMAWWIWKGKYWSSWRALWAEAKVFDALWGGRKNKTDRQDPSVTGTFQNSSPVSQKQLVKRSNVIMKWSDGTPPPRFFLDDLPSWGTLKCCHSTSFSTMYMYFIFSFLKCYLGRKLSVGNHMNFSNNSQVLCKPNFMLSHLSTVSEPFLYQKA